MAPEVVGQKYTAAAHRLRIHMDVTIGNLDLTIELFQALDMQIHWPRPNNAAARNRHFSPTFAGHGQAESKRSGGPHGADQIIGRTVAQIYGLYSPVPVPDLVDLGAPTCCKIATMERMSLRSGTLCSSTASSVNRLAAKMGSAAIFAHRCQPCRRGVRWPQL